MRNTSKILEAMRVLLARCGWGTLTVSLAQNSPIDRCPTLSFHYDHPDRRRHIQCFSLEELARFFDFSLAELPDVDRSDEIAALVQERDDAIARADAVSCTLNDHTASLTQLKLEHYNTLRSLRRSQKNLNSALTRAVDAEQWNATLRRRLRLGHGFVMEAPAESITAENVLEAFGWTRDGLHEIAPAE